MTKEELAALKVDAALHDDPTLKEIKDVATAMKVLVDTKAMVGRSIRIPGPDAGDEDKKAFREQLKTKVPDLIELPADPTKFAEAEGSIFERLGRPKDVKEYPSFKDSKIEVPEGVQVNEEELRGYAHKLGLTKKQYATLAAEVVAERAKVHKLSSEARQALKRELGEAFTDRLEAAASAAKKLGADEAMVEALRSGNVPAAQAKTWISVAKALGEEGSEFGRNGGGGSGKITPTEAKLQLAEIRKNPAFTDRSNPAHADIVKRNYELTKIAYPD